MGISIRENEKIIKIVRQDALVLMPLLSWVIIVTLLFIWHHAGNYDFEGKWAFVRSGSIIVATYAVARKIWTWHNSVLLVTNQRVAAHIRHGIFSKTLVDLLYRDIQEISYTKQGFYSTLGNYGDLKIRTGSDTHVFDHMQNPEEIVAIINKIR